MPTTKKPAPKPRQRDHAREAANRATGRQVNLSLTSEERAALDGLAAALGAPMKASVLAAVRAAQVALDGGTLAAVRRELRSDLEPAKPGPKVAGDSGE
jgi:hypothetical protein